ncbi:E3 ubiquitin-protein ligase COP1-like isoform X1 [Daktulosphaira vitifoliae]|uniref:E3 ubiquitin-protein ligase COP1-like isoform X1 n=1 Tax=Daktulosphaira vitifoliae TaxID=58002 RepID=UPI0021A9BE71|nr:E3 ubiquitin-protein ligase COP1-like isoform X1 [Daktulosphaira vitifoliae]
MSDMTEEQNPITRPVKRQHLASSASNEYSSTKIASDYCCPICYELVDEAHITKCGHSFCYSCISTSLESKTTCPKCGHNLSGGLRDVFPNFALDKLVTKFKLQNPRRKMDSCKTGIVSGLRGFVTAESKKLTLTDVDAMLELLTKRKRKLEAESALAQNRLLHEFLEKLLCEKETQMKRIGRQVEIVKRDVEVVEKLLKDWEAKRSSTPDLESSKSNDKNHFQNENLISSLNTGGCGNIQRRRMCTHFDDFVDCYFSLRAKELVFGKTLAEPININVEPVNIEEDPDNSLDAFRENLVKFSRYNSLRPIATLNYGTDMFNNSTIVSSIEFDKDDEYFAIAGVTKRIKVFDYDCVLRDAVDIHYPCVEMVSASKISCISWNSFRKNTIASSDYEGAVSIWDAGTGQRTRVFREHEKRCWSVDFNKADAGLMASGSDDARVKLWTLNQDRSVACLEAKANVCCVKFNPDSSSHLAFGSADHCVHYYDLRHPKRALATFKGHKKAVSYVKFLNGREMVSASTDSQLKLWNVDDAAEGCLRSFVGHTNEKNFVGLATDGDYIACGSENNSLYVYYKGLQKRLFTFKFEPSTSILSSEAEEVKDKRKDDDVNEFVSAVCWRQTSNIIMAANSQGIIKVLELI